MCGVQTGCSRKAFDHNEAELLHLRTIGIAATLYKVAKTECPNDFDTPDFQIYLDTTTIDDEWGGLT